MKIKTPKNPAELRAMLRAQTQEDMKEAVRTGVASIDEAVRATATRMDEIDARVAAIEANSQRQMLPGSGDDGRGEDWDGRFDFGNIFRSLMLKSVNEPESVWRKAAENEWEMHDQLRAQGVSPDNLGGFLVPGQVLIDQVIPLLRPRLIALLLGATEVDFLSTPVDMPREVTDPVTEALAENETQTASDAEIGNMRIEPHRAQAYIEASRRLFRNGPGAQTLIVNMMTKKLATEINGWALSGTGGKEPLGIINQPGVGTVDFSTAGPMPIDPTAGVVPHEAFGQIQLMSEQLALSDAFEGAVNLGWAIPAKGKRFFRMIKSESTADAQGDALEMGRQSVYDAAAKEIDGMPFAVSTQLSSGAEAEIILGDWETLIMATFGNMILETSNVAGEAMRQGQTHIVAAMEVDTAVTQPGAFVVTSGLDLSGF